MNQAARYSVKEDQDCRGLFGDDAVFGDNA